MGRSPRLECLQDTEVRGVTARKPSNRRPAQACLQRANDHPFFMGRSPRLECPQDTEVRGATAFSPRIRVRQKKPLELLTQGVKYLEGIIPFSLYSLPCKIMRPPTTL